LALDRFYIETETNVPLLALTIPVYDGLEVGILLKLFKKE